MLNRIIDALRKDQAVMFPPADDKNIRFVSSMLSSQRFASVPPHYAELLKLSDGLAWNGVELFGTRAVERKKQNYVFPGLVEANLEFLGNEFFTGKLMIGRASEEMLVYNSLDKRFSTVYRMDFSITGVFPTFAEMLYIFVDGLF